VEGDLVQVTERYAGRRKALIGTAALIATTLAALSVATLTSCNRTPTRPSQPPFIARVELIAPTSLAPGATAQLRLIAHRSDGTFEDVTATARFHSGSSEVLAVSPDGIATGLKLGESGVTGQTERFSSTHEVVVVPDGTFRVVGQVIEEDTSGLPVAGVRVEADGAPPDSTDLSGRYRLYGAPGRARMRVSKNGYITKELTLDISDHHTENVALALAGPRLDLAGSYQLTFEASPECRGRIPETLLTRRYAAAITQSGAAIRVVLTGANFAGGSYVVPDVRAEQPGGVLEFPNYGHCESFVGAKYLVEKVDDTTHLWITGVARLSPAGQGFAGTLVGMFAIYPSHPCCCPAAQAWCESSFHRVTLTR
jgi:hypothetical protein